MIFRTISSAAVAGVLAGLFLFLVQRWTTLPLIRVAETYEASTSGAQPHSNSDSAFEKEPLRSASTLLGDMFVAIGFGLILTGIYALSGEDGGFSGLLRGAAGFATFHLGPAMVVPPALPGMEVAGLSLRQTGWLVAASSTGIGLALLVFCKSRVRYAAILLLVAPAALLRGLFPIPPATTSFPSVAALEHVFIVRTLAGGLLFWIVLGILSGYLFARAQENDELGA